jgi:hypothetical protein
MEIIYPDDFVSYVSLTTSALDLRSLAFFRFLLASVILYDIWDRFPYIYAWYTDFGALLSFEFSFPCAMTAHLRSQVLCRGKHYSSNFGLM